MPVYMAEIDLVVWLPQPDIKTNVLSNPGATSHSIHKLFGKLEKLTLPPLLLRQQMQLLFVLHMYVCDKRQIFTIHCHRYAHTIANIHLIIVLESMTHYCSFKLPHFLHIINMTSMENLLVNSKNSSCHTDSSLELIQNECHRYTQNMSKSDSVHM